MLVINDGETNPTRHEFYIRLFMCTHAVLLHSSLRDGSTQLGKEGKEPQDKSCADPEQMLWSMSLCLLKEKKKETKLKPLRNCYRTHCFTGALKRAVDRKSSAGHIPCLCGVIYEAWNRVLWSTVTTRQSDSLEGGRETHNKATRIQTARYMCGQKYNWTKDTPKLYTFNVYLNNFLP